ncbi:hypothetical protein [Fibrobacter sp.]|uniref:hypothetical protein n=1 Tax=Fibrobacter sp. TaxID=35828 RepID=UPI0025C3F30E|nr:hypothetical protein [Fibrobacter sp.]MBR2058697.1 hypothetical protein [Fibrobacter sp.]MBR4006746.1 hypothetical protein [Fibrobacter sp.]
MARGILWIVLTVCALLLAGCSSHPPSAAQFMNARNGINFVAGGAVRVGDLDNRKIPGRDDESVSYEEGYWNTDLALSFAFPYAVVALDLEDYTYRTIMGGRSQYFGVQGWYGFAADDRGDDVSSRMRHMGGVMFVEQYPVSENFKVGISEHISRNSYRVIDDPGCCTFNKLYPEVYSEFGAGAYVVYKGFSAEFRYGREIGAPNNRFYFQLNYAFFLKEWNYSK